MGWWWLSNVEAMERMRPREHWQHHPSRSQLGVALLLSLVLLFGALARLLALLGSLLGVGEAGPVLAAGLEELGEALKQFIVVRVPLKE